MRISDWSSDVCSSDLSRPCATWTSSTRSPRWRRQSTPSTRKARRTLRWNWTQRLTRSVPPTWLLSGRGRNGLALDTGRLSGRSTGRCRWGVMWRERHDRRLSRFEGLPARQAFDLGRALPGLPRATAQSQREDIGAGSDLQGAHAFLPRSPHSANRGRVGRSHGIAWKIGRASWRETVGQDWKKSEGAV